jgi:hypothetical protein
MPNFQEVNHVKKHIVGELLYADIRIFQDIGNSALPTAFQLSVDIRLAGAVVGQTGAPPTHQIALKDGPITVKFLGALDVGDLQAQIDDWRGVLSDGVTNSQKPHWEDASSVIFKISALGYVSVPLKIFPIKVRVDLTHGDIVTVLHRNAAGSTVGVESLAATA